MDRTKRRRHRDRWSESDTERKKACLLVAGTRTFDDYDLLKETLDGLKKKYDIRVVIVGGSIDKDGICRHYGADKLAHQWAEKSKIVGLWVNTHWANWKKFKDGRAGPIRNTEMVDDLLGRKEAKLKIAVFFWDGKSKGTLDCLTKCRRAKVKRKVVRY